LPLHCRLELCVTLSTQLLPRVGLADRSASQQRLNHRLHGRSGCGRALRLTVGLGLRECRLRKATRGQLHRRNGVEALDEQACASDSEGRHDDLFACFECVVVLFEVLSTWGSGRLVPRLTVTRQDMDRMPLSTCPCSAQCIDLHVSSMSAATKLLGSSYKALSLQPCIHALLDPGQRTGTRYFFLWLIFATIVSPVRVP